VLTCLPPAHQVKVQALDFSPDEATLVSLGGPDDNNLVGIHSPAHLKQQACAVHSIQAVVLQQPCSTQHLWATSCRQAAHSARA
jgi:hypothetical protein